MVQHTGLKQSIIQISVAIGSELGEEGLTMRGIASRLGVSATALYQHFESKASILREIRIYGSDLLRQEVIQPLEALPEPADRLRSLMNNYIVFSQTHPWLYSMLMEHEQIDYSSMTSDEVVEFLQPLLKVQSWVREGIEKGQFRKELEPELTAIRMWASVHGLCSMVNSKRIDKNHPAFPVTNPEAFLKNFVENIMLTILVL